MMKEYSSSAVINKKKKSDRGIMMQGKQKNLTRVVALLISLLLVSSGLVGCGNNGGTSSAKDPQPGTSQSGTTEQTPSTVEEDPFKEHVEITVSIWDSSDDAVNKETEPIYAAISEKLNLTIKMQPITYDDYQTKIQMWAASNQLPDVFAMDAFGSKNYSNWTKQNIVKAIPDDLSQYPNLQAYLNSESFQAMKSSDGKLYCIPRANYTNLKYGMMDNVLIYRWDWAQQLGITKEPESYDDFVNMLKAFVEKDPEGKSTVGLTFKDPSVMTGRLLMAYNPVATYGDNADYKWIKEDGKFIPAYFSKNTPEGIKAIKNMFEMGVIDKDLAILKYKEGDAKFYSGRAGATVTNSIKELEFNKTYPDKNIKDCVKVLKIWPSADGNRYQYVDGASSSESYISAKVDDKKMDRILRLYDYLISDEGKAYYQYGIEGVDYVREGDKIIYMEDGKVVDAPSTDLEKRYASKKSLGNLVQWGSDFYWDPTNPEALASPNSFAMSIEYINWGMENMKIADYKLPLTFLSTPAKDKFTLSINDDIIKIMYDNRPVEEQWAEIVKGYEDKGLNDVIKEVNEEAAKLGIN